MLRWLSGGRVSRLRGGIIYARGYSADNRNRKNKCVVVGIVAIEGTEQQ